MGFANECASQIAKSMANQQDEIIRQAISSRIGDQWELADLEGRFMQAFSQHMGVRTFYLDGKPLVEFYPAESVQDEFGTQWHSWLKGGRQKYRAFPAQQGGPAD